MEVHNNPLLHNQTETFAVNKKFIQINSQRICIRWVGKESFPLFLIIHGSGSRSNSADYLSLLHEFTIRFADIPLYIVAGMYNHF